MSLNSHIYYILGPTLFVKHMILKKGKVSHTNICFIPTCLETANKKPKWTIDQTWPWICLVCLYTLSQHFKFRRPMQKFRLLQEPNLDPLSPSYCLVCVQRLPSVWDMCFWGYWSHLAFSLTQVISFPSISIWVSNFWLIVYFDKYLKVLKDSLINL